MGWIQSDQLPGLPVGADLVGPANGIQDADQIVTDFTETDES